MRNRLKKTWLSIWTTLLLILGGVAFAQDDPIDAETMKNATESVESEVQTETDKATTERRQKILQEAVDALAKTKEALAALEEDRVDDALDDLAVTTGKLELLVARDPGLALAPTDVGIISHDLYGTTDAIRQAIKRAEEALDEGRIQDARQLLNGLGSEMIISVTNVPLATYPEAIKAITPLIDEGKIDEAKASLQAALNTVVITEHVIPLPALRAEALISRTETLAEKTDRSDEENAELADKLSAARDQLKMAELLGYGNRKDYKQLYSQLDEIVEKTDEGETGEGLFEKLKNSMASLWN